MLEQYGDEFTAAAIGLFHKILGEELLGDAVYSKDFIYELFDSGGSMNVGLYIQDDGAHNTYTVSDRWYAESFGALMDSYKLFSREIYPNHLFHLVPGSKYGIMDYQVVDWGVDAVSKNETAIVGWIDYAILPRPDNHDPSALWAGNTGEGSGDWAGWLVMSRQFVLEKREDGYWYCTGLGTGGYTLPEKYIE